TAQACLNDQGQLSIYSTDTSEAPTLNLLLLDVLTAQKLARIGYLAGESARRDRGRAGQEHLAFLVSHAPREIAVRCADALKRLIHAAERVHRAAQASSTSGVFSHLHTGIHEDLPDGLVAPTRRLQIVNNLRRRRHAKGVNDHALSPENA